MCGSMFRIGSAPGNCISPDRIKAMTLADILFAGRDSGRENVSASKVTVEAATGSYAVHPAPTSLACQPIAGTRNETLDLYSDVLTINAPQTGVATQDHQTELLAFKGAKTPAEASFGNQPLRHHDPTCGPPAIIGDISNTYLCRGKERQP